MEAVIISIIIFVAILLVLVILAQNSKGGGLSSQFGGSGASNMIGVKKTTDLLERLTWGLAITMLALTMGVNILDGPANVDEFQERIEQQSPPALDINPDLLDTEGSITPAEEGNSDLLQQLESQPDSSN